MRLRAFDVITVYQCNYIGTQEVFQVTAGDTAGYDAHYTGIGGLTQRSIIEWAWYHEYSVGLLRSIAGGRKWRTGVPDRKHPCDLVSCTYHSLDDGGAGFNNHSATVGDIDDLPSHACKYSFLHVPAIDLCTFAAR